MLDVLAQHFVGTHGSCQRMSAGAPAATPSSPAPTSHLRELLAHRSGEGADPRLRRLRCRLVPAPDISKGRWRLHHSAHCLEAGNGENPCLKALHGRRG